MEGGRGWVGILGWTKVETLALQPLHVEVSAYREKKKLHTAVLAMDSSVPSCTLSESPKRSLKV